MNLNKIHHLLLSQANPLIYFLKSSLLEEELIHDKEFLYRILNTRFIVPLQKMSYQEIEGSSGEAMPILLFKSDFTPFFSFYSTISKAKKITQTENIISTDYYNNLLFRDMCAFDILELLLENDIKEADIDADKWSVSPLHIKKTRANSWKKTLEAVLKTETYCEQSVDVKINSLLETIINEIKQQKFITNISLEQKQLSKFTKYKFYFSSKEDPYEWFNEYAALLEKINTIAKDNANIFIDFICVFENEFSYLNLDKGLQVSAANKN